MQMININMFKTENFNFLPCPEENYVEFMKKIYNLSDLCDIDPSLYDS